jgi:hypothetical protein
MLQFLQFLYDHPGFAACLGVFAIVVILALGGVGDAWIRAANETKKKDGN